MNLMYAEMGLKALTGLGSFLVGREESKLARSVKKYRETMAALSAAQSLNAVTANEAATADKASFARASIQTASLQDSANYAVETAAAGIVGNSARMGALQREADKARADTSLTRQYGATRRQFGQQRREIELQKIYQTDVSVVETPSIGATLFGMAEDTLGIWDAYNPSSRQSSTLLDRSTS